MYSSEIAGERKAAAFDRRFAAYCVTHPDFAKRVETARENAWYNKALRERLDTLDLDHDSWERAYTAERKPVDHPETPNELED
jgi:hypothetical protein